MATLTPSKAWQHVEKSGSTTNAITAIAARLEPKARTRFLEAMRSLDTSDLDALVDAIRGRDAEQIARLLKVPDLAKPLKPLTDLLHRGYVLSGQAGAAQLVGLLDTPFSFNLTSPTAINWARLNGARLVTDISDQARITIREVVAQGLQKGIAPIEQARIIRNVVGLTERQATAVLNYRLDLLANGRSGEDVARLGERYARELLNYRSKLIARTETIDASNQGLMESWNQAANQGLIDRESTRRVWQTAEDDRVCPICDPMDGDTVAFDGEAFTGGDGSKAMAPPIHRFCRCSQALVL